MKAPRISKGPAAGDCYCCQLAGRGVKPLSPDSFLLSLRESVSGARASLYIQKGAGVCAPAIPPSPLAVGGSHQKHAQGQGNEGVKAMSLRKPIQLEKRPRLAPAPSPTE